LGGHAAKDMSLASRSEMIKMPRKTICAAAGIALACAAGYSLSLLAQANTADLDLRWLQQSEKEDRLPIAPTPRDSDRVVSLDLPSHGISIVTRQTRPIMESAVRMPRPPSARTVPATPVREVPNERTQKDRLPVGCEPAFSPVTTPAFAHIGVRCDS
jgi:hypothetical protein